MAGWHPRNDDEMPTDQSQDPDINKFQVQRNYQTIGEESMNSGESEHGARDRDIGLP